MTANLQSLVRIAIAPGIVGTRTAASRAKSRSGLLIESCRTSQRQSLHTSASKLAGSGTQTSAEQISSEQPSSSTVSTFNNPKWRHPTLGFAAVDLPRLIYLKLPSATTKDDVKALIVRAGVSDAQITMYYSLDTGKPISFCFLTVSDKDKVDTTVAALSNFTVLGSDLTPKKFDYNKVSQWTQPVLSAGWFPSPSDDVESRVIRPPITEPPKLLPPLMAEQWILFSNLPSLHPAKKEQLSRITREFYNKFHQYDVVGITTPNLHRNPYHGWCCKILFGNSEDAKAARKSHLDGRLFMGLTARAKTYRGGPEIHKALWNYRLSLPKGMPDNEVSDLLEDKYKALFKVRGVDRQRLSQYPTPESAIGLKTDAPKSD